MATTCKSISAKLKAEGLPLDLYKSDGYFYFEFYQDKVFETHSVYVNSINQLTADEWLKEGRDFAKKVREQYGIGE